MSALVSNGQPPFLLAFDESLRKLNDINAAITKNTENKRKFTGDVLDKLQELHEKVKRIVIKITEIKQKIVALQGQINQNNSGVQAKDAEIVNLKQQIAHMSCTGYMMHLLVIQYNIQPDTGVL
jgi:archaellum component FlaC